MTKDKSILYIVFALLIISPLIIVSPMFLSVDFFKSMTITILAVVAGLVLLYSSWREKKITVSKHPLFVVSTVIALLYVVSSFFSSSAGTSFFGQGNEIDTTSMFLSLWLVLVIVISLAKNTARVLSIYTAIIIPFIVLALFHLLRIVGGADFLTLGVLNSLTASIFGKWYELSILSGLILSLTIPAFEFLTFKKSISTVLYIVSVLALIVLILTNFSLGWTILAFVMVIITIFKSLGYGSKTTPASKKDLIAPFAIAILIISIIFSWKGSAIIGSSIDAMKISHTEISLPWQMTLDVASNTIKQSPWLGAGPNQFAKQYLLYKPITLNNSQFWSAEFLSGVGYVSTAAVTLGFLGIIAWVAFFLVLIRQGIKIAKFKSDDAFTSYTLVSSFLGSALLWVSMIAYTPSHTLLLVTFVVTGIFIGSSTYSGLNTVSTQEWNSGMKRGIVVTIILAIVFILLVLWGIWTLKMTISRVYYQKASAVLNDANLKISPMDRINMAEKSLIDASSWSKSDLYQRSIAEVNILRMQAALNEGQNSTTTELRANAIAIATSSLNAAFIASQNAINIDPFYYTNYLTRAQVGETATSLQIPNGYEATIQAYQGASILNPYNPFIFFKAGQFEGALGNDQLSEKYFSAAVQMKSDYADALIQLGFLYYKNKAYPAAAQAFSQVISVSPNYPNIHYYTGILLARVNKITEAIAEFELAAKANPDDASIPTLISTLKSGRSIFTDSATSATVTPAAISKPSTKSSTSTSIKR